MSDTDRETWWLSFCDASRPKGQHFIGVAIVEVDGPDGFIWAVEKSHRLKINPGGQVAGFLCPRPVAAEHRDRLLSREELEAAFGPLVTMDEMERRGIL